VRAGRPLTAALAAGEVALWYAFVAEQDEPATVASELALLSSEERVRHDRLHGPAQRRSFRAAHVLLRRALSRHLGSAPGVSDSSPAAWRFRSNRHGRPELDLGSDPPLRFNLSHTQGLVACVLTREAAVGVDVETSDRRCDVARVARRCCAPSERADLQTCPDAAQQLRRFLAYWTLKEAYLKALGHGLAGSARSAVFELQGDAGARLVSGARGGAWHFFRLQPGERHQLAIACAGRERPRLRVIESGR